MDSGIVLKKQKLNPGADIKLDHNPENKTEKHLATGEIHNSISRHNKHTDQKQKYESLLEESIQEDPGEKVTTK